MPLGFSFVKFCLCKNALNELLTSCSELLLQSCFLVKFLLLYASFQLIFILECLSFEVFLLHNTLFVLFSPLSAHGLLSSDHLLVALQLQLHLVLRLSLAHFGFKLQRFSFLLFYDLSTLDFELAAVENRVLTVNSPCFPSTSSLLPSLLARRPSKNLEMRQGFKLPIGSQRLLTLAPFSRPAGSKP